MSTVETLYTELDSDIFNALSEIKLLVCDIDGVFSDGRIYLGNDGEELKAFHTRDGYGVKALINCGVEVAVITGRRSAIVQQRMQSLTVKYIVQGQENKADAIQELINTLGLTTRQVASVGDDMPDIGMFNHSTIRIAVNDAHPFVARNANWVTEHRGGFGAVREIADTILQAHGRLEEQHGASV